MAGIEQYIDYEDGLKRILNNKAVYKTLLQSFVKNTYMDQLKTEIAAGDIETAAKTAHTIKGISANLSFVKINEIVMLLESQLKSGFKAEETLQELDEAVEKTLEYIAELVNTL